MNCSHCGANAPDTAKFCTRCGQPLAPPSPPPQRPSPLRPLAIVLAVLIVALGVVIALILAQRSGGTRSYDECMALAARYLEELDYEQAEALYLEAIQIDPRQAAAYRELAQMYIDQGREEEALSLLEQGLAQTGSEELQAIYDELNARLYPPEPEPEPSLWQEAENAYMVFLTEGGYLDDCAGWEDYQPETYSLLDIDGDGTPELLIHSGGSSESDPFSYTLLYGFQDSNIVLAESIYHYSSLRYSSVYHVICYSELRNGVNMGHMACYTYSPFQLSPSISFSWLMNTEIDAVEYSIWTTETETAEVVPETEYDRILESYAFTEPEQLPLPSVETAGNDLSAYADVVQQYEQEYGTLDFQEGGFETYYTGVFLVDLVDLDADGLEELIVGYTAPPLVNWSEYPELPTLDVWRLEEGTPVLAMEGFSMPDSDISSCCEYAYWEGAYYLPTGTIVADDDVTFWTMVDGVFTPAITLERPMGGGTSYINGEAVSQEEADQLFDALHGGENHYTGSIRDGYVNQYLSQEEMPERLRDACAQLGLE
ncbi:MAG TPA: tetratricopeptide repeat protein [Candidatus Onthomonas avicola]|nr:tetratricopeptide repeat protein [Candidatus Onthomonas avicola]